MSDAASPPGSPLRTPEANLSEHGSPAPEEAPAAAATPRHEDEEDDSGKDKHNGDGSVKEDEEEEEEELLSDVDEDQFEDYDPATAYIEERPITIDEDAARGLKSAKRKRAEGEERSRKPKEGRRDKKKRRGGDGDDSGDEAAGGRASTPAKREGGSGASRRAARSTAGGGGGGGERAARKKKEATEAAEPEVNEEDLTPEERRRRALDRAINLAIRNPNKRRRKQDEEDLEQMADEEIAQLKIQMERACMADVEARSEGRPAMSKLQLLPQVLSVLNRNDIQETVLDPETNFLLSVKFFLEPLNDGSLPAYAIQRDIFACLTRLPIEKDALLSSGIGKVVLFYTRSKRAEPAIKRMAERLVGEWSRPILKKTDDFKKRHVETRNYDARTAREAKSQYTLTERPISRFEQDKEVQLAPPVVNPNRAQPVGLPQSYTIAPKSTFEGHRGAEFRPIGAGSMEAFRKMTQKAKQRNKKK